MKFEDFWEIYLNENLVEHYDSVKEVFSKELESYVEEEYDLGEVLTEFIGLYDNAKEFEKIIEFTKILKNKNNKIFKEVFPYFDDFLIDYYCHHNKEEGLAETARDYMEFPLKDYDLLLKSLRKLIYYGYSVLGEKIIEKAYGEVKKSSGLIQGAEYDLALFKNQIELEKGFERYEKDKRYDWILYKENLGRFDFETSDDYIELLEEGFTKSEEQLGEQFLLEFKDKKREKGVELLEKGFMKSMRGKNMSFPISGSIWNNMYNYWERKKGQNTSEKYFDLTEKEFKAFVRSKSGFILDYRFESVLILWGSSYVYDYLRSAELIEVDQYERIKNIIKKLKEALIKENRENLWRYDFVHRWSKSQMVSEEEQRAEIEIFEKSYNYKAEVGRIREGFFIESRASTEKRLLDFEKQIEERSPTPIKREFPKIGRNEKITVKYKDGTVKKQVKYKRVKEDIEKGNCEII